MQMYSNEYKYGIIPSKTERGLRSRTSVVDEDDVVADLGVV